MLLKNIFKNWRLLGYYLFGFLLTTVFWFLFLLQVYNVITERIEIAETADDYFITEGKVQNQKTKVKWLDREGYPSRSHNMIPNITYSAEIVYTDQNGEMWTYLYEQGEKKVKEGQIVKIAHNPKDSKDRGLAYYDIFVQAYVPRERNTFMTRDLIQTVIYIVILWIIVPILGYEMAHLVADMAMEHNTKEMTEEEKMELWPPLTRQNHRARKNLSLILAMILVWVGWLADKNGFPEALFPGKDYICYIPAVLALFYSIYHWIRFFQSEPQDEEDEL